MLTKYAELLRSAFDSYLVQVDRGVLEPALDYLPYDFDEIELRRWSLLGAEMVSDELRELTNILNHWHGSLVRWQAWNTVIRDYGQDDAWNLRREFLEGLAHHCLLNPSSARDTFTFVATNSMHQVRLASGTGYGDFLEGDPIAHGKKPRNLTRAQKERRLQGILAPWPEGESFMAALQSIDDTQYRKVTSDYRNRSSHAIAPRLGLGLTRAVVRSVIPATRMKKQSDGRFRPIPIPGKMSVSYGFGGTPPLDLEDARTANLDQYSRARTCYERYRHVLGIGMARLPATM
jgi:hypothetical protein